MLTRLQGPPAGEWDNVLQFKFLKMAFVLSITININRNLTVSKNQKVFTLMNRCKLLQILYDFNSLIKWKRRKTIRCVGSASCWSQEWFILI